MPRLPDDALSALELVARAVAEGRSSVECHALLEHARRLQAGPDGREHRMGSANPMVAHAHLGVAQGFRSENVDSSSGTDVNEVWVTLPPSILEDLARDFPWVAEWSSAVAARIAQLAPDLRAAALQLALQKLFEALLKMVS